VLVLVRICQSVSSSSSCLTSLAQLIIYGYGFRCRTLFEEVDYMAGKNVQAEDAHRSKHRTQLTGSSQHSSRRRSHQRPAAV